MRYLMWRVTAVALDVLLLALGLLVGWRLRLRRVSDGRGWTANLTLSRRHTPNNSEVPVQTGWIKVERPMSDHPERHSQGEA